jgi:peroxiredoxin family protein
MGTEFDVLNYEMIRTGKTPFGTWENMPTEKSESFLECSECQLKIDLAKPFSCPHHPAGIHCAISKTRPHNYGKFFWNSNIRLLILDEVHRCGAVDSLNSDMLVGAKIAGIPVLGLSATVADSPLNFRALGYLLGLHHLVDRKDANLPGFYRWANRLGCRKSPFGGLQFMGNEEFRRHKMAQLHQEIFPSRGERVRIEELGDAFPACHITAELYDLKESGRIDELYAEMDDAIRELNERKLGDRSVELPLTKLLRARQEVELLKAPLFEEIANEAIASGRTVGIFVNFTATLDALQKRLKWKCRIDGHQRGKSGQTQRQGFIDDIQADRERGILLNNQAGGVSISLHDLTGKYPRGGLVSLPNSASAFRQVCGRFPRAGGKSKSFYRVILAANTVEVKTHRQLSQKLNQIDALNDGDLWAANLPLSSHSLDALTNFNLTE